MLGPYPKQISAVICCLSRLDLNLCSLRLQLVAAGLRLLNMVDVAAGARRAAYPGSYFLHQKG